MKNDINKLDKNGTHFEPNRRRQCERCVHCDRKIPTQVIGGCNDIHCEKKDAYIDWDRSCECFSRRKDGSRPKYEKPINTSPDFPRDPNDTSTWPK